MLEKKITYKTTNTYATLNSLSDETKNVWIVFHGIGYLSKYFLKYFDELPKTENYIIAPQAPSKYYLNNQYRHVGASWLTKENTTVETKNVLSYLDEIYASENIPEHCDIIIFGFSQGVSIASRWTAKKQLKCSQLVLYAGGMPNELKAEDFDFLRKHNTKVTTLVGNKDEYITKELLQSESDKIKTIFRGKANQIIFDGKHEVKKKLIHSLIQ